MILGVSGVAGSGKDTFARFLAEDYGFQVVSLADPLKRICRDVFAFTDEQLWGPSEARSVPDPRYPRPDGTFLTVREALQKLGTEWGRGCYPNVWVDCALRLARRLEQDPRLRSDPRLAAGAAHAEGAGRGGEGLVVISDVRFQNEFDAVRAAGGWLVRVRRAGAGLVGQAGVHVSEAEQTGISDDAFDLVIENNGTLEELRVQAAVAIVWLHDVRWKL